jgi:hypothetical protein
MGERAPYDNYFYNRRSRGMSHLLGVSALGTLLQFILRSSIDERLSAADADLCTIFVLGHHIDEDSGRILVLFSCIKFMMAAWEEKNLGYSDGQLLADVTFKIFKEMGLDMFTLMTQDISQTGKWVAFGPTTHQDTQQFKLAGDIVEPQVSELER